jgi:hypothetical protein
VNVDAFTLNPCPDSKERDCIRSKVLSFILDYIDCELKQSNYIVHERLDLLWFFKTKASKREVHFEFVNHFEEVLCNESSGAQLVLKISE